ncbi:hypothetical protein CH35J_007953 [Colletotrichum higginsianum]|uniref:Uncharacterized protein n=1 Tax=Colletotrichum higginsianum TaxID=80884 RepID=A0A4T0VSD6_9PEZI|nr:hypothetical protein CH35J_007953 [Colletotrichum higginsianum]
METGGSMTQTKGTRRALAALHDPGPSARKEAARTRDQIIELGSFSFCRLLLTPRSDGYDPALRWLFKSHLNIQSTSVDKDSSLLQTSPLLMNIADHFQIGTHDTTSILGVPLDQVILVGKTSYPSSPVTGLLQHLALSISMPRSVQLTAPAGEFGTLE